MFVNGACRRFGPEFRVMCACKLELAMRQNVQQTNDKIETPQSPFKSFFFITLTVFDLNIAIVDTRSFKKLCIIA
jgi:hypothetical protein